MHGVIHCIDEDDKILAIFEVGVNFVENTPKGIVVSTKVSDGVVNLKAAEFEFYYNGISSSLIRQT